VSPIVQSGHVEEDIYETLPSSSPPPLLPRRQEEPLPPRPPSRSSYCTIQNAENISNCYESIYNPKDEKDSNNYESIYGGPLRLDWDVASNRDSLVSADQQSNSIYGRSFAGNWPNDDGLLYKATSDLSASDRSDEWIDISDGEDDKITDEFVV
jgi:hypothetical protein